MNEPNKDMQYYTDKRLWNCAVRGIPCEYGICDECPNTNKNRRGDDDEEEQSR